MCDMMSETAACVPVFSHFLVVFHSPQRESVALGLKEVGSWQLQDQLSVSLSVPNSIQSWHRLFGHVVKVHLHLRIISVTRFN